MRFKKIIENNINDGDMIELIKLDQLKINYKIRL